MRIFISSIEVSHFLINRRSLDILKKLSTESNQKTLSGEKGIFLDRIEKDSTCALNKPYWGILACGKSTWALTVSLSMVSTVLRREHFYFL